MMIPRVGRGIQVRIPSTGQTLEYPEGTPPNVIEAQLLEMESPELAPNPYGNGFVGQMAQLFGLTKQMTPPPSTLPNLGAKDVMGMSPQQTTATLNMVQQSNEDAAAQRAQQQQERTAQFEKAQDRKQELRLYKTQLQNHLDERKIEAQTAQMKADYDAQEAESKRQHEAWKLRTQMSKPFNVAPGTDVAQFNPDTGSVSSVYENPAVPKWMDEVYYQDADGTTKSGSGWVHDDGTFEPAGPAITKNVVRDNFPVQVNGVTEYHTAVLDQTGKVVQDIGPSKPTGTGGVRKPVPADAVMNRLRKLYATAYGDIAAVDENGTVKIPYAFAKQAMPLLGVEDPAVLYDLVSLGLIEGGSSDYLLPDARRQEAQQMTATSQQAVTQQPAAAPAATQQSATPTQAAAPTPTAQYIKKNPVIGRSPSGNPIILMNGEEVEVAQ